MKRIHSKETIEKIRKSLQGRKLTDEHREKLRQAHLGVKFSPEHRLGVLKTLKPMKKGDTLIELYGLERANQIKEKQRNAKLGKKGFQKGFKKEEHWKWIADREKVKKSEKKHLDGLYREWMNSVKKRDNWKCRISNDSCKGKLESHHIYDWKNFPKLRYQINNGITLCHAHHPRKRAEEKRLIPTFRELVPVSKDLN